VKNDTCRERLLTAKCAKNSREERKETLNYKMPVGEQHQPIFFAFVCTSRHAAAQNWQNPAK
jgi:hypothetical protein